MGKFEHIVTQISLLPQSRQDEIADLLAEAFVGDITDQPDLSAAQITENNNFISKPAPLVSESEVEAFFADAPTTKS